MSHKASKREIWVFMLGVALIVLVIVLAKVLP